MTTFTDCEGSPEGTWSRAVLTRLDEIRERRIMKSIANQPTQPDDDWTHPVIHGDGGPVNWHETKSKALAEMAGIVRNQEAEIARLQHLRDQTFKLLDAMFGPPLPTSIAAAHHAAILAAIELGYEAKAGDPPPADWEHQPDLVFETDSSDFEKWWTELVRQHAGTIQAKAEEYGTNSLVEVGRLYARARGRDPVGIAEAVELGCAVYAYGKMQRVIDALLKDRLPSEDTWRDAMIYAAMALFAREHGHWP